jgi:hypothetical protein
MPTQGRRPRGADCGIGNAETMKFVYDPYDPGLAVCTAENLLHSGIFCAVDTKRNRLT